MLYCASCYITTRDHTQVSFLPGSTIFSVMHESTRKFNWFIVVCGVIQKNSPENVNAGWLAGKIKYTLENIVLYGK